MFYDSEDIKRVATISAQVRDMAIKKDYDSFFETKKMALYTFCPINYEIGQALYDQADKLQSESYETKYKKLVEAIQEYGGRLFRFMIENFAGDTKQAERALSQGLRNYFSRQTARRVALRYSEIERMIGGKLPDEAYEYYKMEPFWRAQNEFSKAWRDYGYVHIMVSHYTDPEIVFEK